MALALAGRSAGLVPALRVPASTNSARQNAALRSSCSLCLRSGILVKDIAIVNTPGCMAVRPLSRGLHWANMPLSSVGCRAITVARPATGRERRMCSNSNVAENRSSSVVGEELSAGDLALSAQIKAKGDTIRDLKAGGVTKDELRPHIEELLELKQLYVKATGEPWGAPLEEKKPPKDSSSSSKQMDTRKADKARKAEQARLAAAARDPLQDIPRVLYPSKEELEAGVEEPAQKVGDYILHRSHHETGRRFSRVRELGIDGGVSIGEQVWIRGRVHQVRGKGGSAFLVLRQDAASTVQAVCFKDKANPEESKK